MVCQTTTMATVTHSALRAGVHDFVFLEETGDRFRLFASSANASRSRLVRHRGSCFVLIDLGILEFLERKVGWVCIYV